MHAYLIVGRNKERIEKEINLLKKQLKVEIVDFELAKIADTRSLGKFTQLGVSKPTAILIHYIDSATPSALNAFLKNLEEPQENLYYILTAANIHVLPETIVSRCQVITVGNRKKTENDKQMRKFIDSPKGKQISTVSDIRDRVDAINFTEDLIESAHSLLYSNEADYKGIEKLLTSAENTRLALKANGNVTLQLTNLVASING